MKKRIISIFLSVIMLMSLFTLPAYAVDGFGTTIDVSDGETYPKITLTAAESTNSTSYEIFIIDPTHEDIAYDQGIDANYATVEELIEADTSASGFKTTVSGACINIESIITIKFNGSSLTAEKELESGLTDGVYWFVAWGSGLGTGTGYQATIKGDKVIAAQSTVEFNVNAETYPSAAYIGSDAENDLEVSVDAEKEFTIADKAPSKNKFKLANYKLLGWHTDKTATTALETATSLAENKTLTLYAIWQLKDEPAVPGTITEKYFDGITLADVELPTTTNDNVQWTWDDDSTTLTVGTEQEFLANSVAETENYRKVEDKKVKVTINVGAVSFRNNSGNKVLANTTLNDVDISTLGIEAYDPNAKTSYNLTDGTFTWKNAGTTAITEDTKAQPFTFVPKAEDQTNYGTSIEGTYTFTLQGENGMTASADKTKVQYGEQFTVTAVPGATNSNPVTFTDITNAKLISQDGYVAIFEATTYTGYASVTVNQEANEDVAGKTIVINNIELTPCVVVLEGTITADNKTYDGLDDATIPTVLNTDLKIKKVNNTDEVILTGTLSGAFRNATAEEEKTVDITPNVSLDGSHKDYYTLTGTDWQETTTADIIARPVTLQLIASKDKEYGTLQTLVVSDFEAVAATQTTGLVSPDTITSLGIAGFSSNGLAVDADVNATGYAIDVTSHTNTNYTINVTSTIKVSATDLDFEVLNLEKPYNPSTGAALSEENKTAILEALRAAAIEADRDNGDLTLNFEAITYPDENADDDYADMTVTGSLLLSGTESGNYTLGTVTLKGKITKADQVLSTENEGDSLYLGETLQLVVTGKENPTLNYEVTSGNAEVSTTGLVTPTGTGAVVITVTSDETANYKAGSLVINLTVGNKKDLTVTGISDKEITYGADFAVSDFIDSQIKITDGDVTLTSNDYTFDWDTAPATSTAGKINHGTYTATVKLEGTAASQYNLDGTTTVTLTVNQRPITIATENGKEIKKYYDTDTDLEAENETAINSLLKESDKISVGGNTDIVSLKLDNAKFSGTGNVVNGPISGITLDGTDANNYALTANVVGIIEAREITLPADAEIYKYYDTKADIGTSEGTTYNIIVPETGETVKVTINSGNYNQPDVTASSFEVTGYTLEVNNQTTQNYYLKSPSIIEDATIKPATMKDIDIEDITATYGDDNKTIKLIGTAPAGSTITYQVVNHADDTLSETTYTNANSDYAEVVNTNEVKIKNAVGANTVMVMVKITNPNYETYYASGSLTIDPKDVELDTEFASLGTTINSPVDLTGIKPFIVGIDSKNLILGIDYDVEYSFVEDPEGTGLAMNGASSTTAPTAKGKAKFKVEATLKGESNTKNYNLITDEVTFDVNVGDGLFKIVFYRNDGTDTTTAMENNAIGVAVTLKPNMDLTRDGYVFKGWATGENTGVVYDEAEEADVTFEKDYKNETLVDKGEVRLYAVWADAYKLTVNAGVGGTAAIGSGSYEAGTKVNIGVTVNDSDYVFKAWEVKGTVNDLDTTKNEQEITMPGEAVELTATFKAKLKITPQIAISKKSSEASKIKVSDFIADAAPRLDDDKVKDLFTAAPAATGTPGEFEGNGVTITFYTDNTYTVQSDITAIPTAVGTYYYTVTVKADADNTPTDKYILQKLDTPVNGILTITKSSSTGGGGGGGTPSSYVVTYDAGENGRLSAGDAATEKVSAGKAPVNIPDVIADDGYKFLGWSKDGENVIDLSKETVTKNTTYTALYAPYGFSDGVNHQHYMIGRAEDTFAPMGELTRVEAATMLARLTPGFSEDGSYSPSDFGDVSADHWANKYISFAQAEGIINGYENEDGTYSFNPDAPVTRAEFSAMIVRFKNISQQSESRFEDVAGHWAEGYIAALVDAGIIGGYEDGTFRPDRTINRAEATKIVNGAVGRTPDESIDLIDAGYNNKFSDVNVNDWFFHHVMEASLDHPAEDFH